MEVVDISSTESDDEELMRYLEELRERKRRRKRGAVQEEGKYM